MKKFLSLVLALVMTMSLVTISAGATEYKDLTDKDEIQYEEAVAVLNRIGIITGYDDGTFRPETELTRGAAAKIIVSLLIGPDAANALPNDSSPYPDVPAGHTFAGVISFCKTSEIISGYGDGTFKPANSLTGFAFAKMLLGALGYDSDSEGFTGTGWTMNVARLGNSAGLFNRISFSGAEAVNREEACQLALNTLKATMVEYTGGFNIVSGDATIVGNQTRTYVTSNQEYATHISDQRAGGENGGSGNANDNHYTVEFGEEHFKDLRMNDEQASIDAYGRPSNEWSYKLVTIGTFPVAPNFSYTTQVAHNVETVSDSSKVRALGLSGYKVDEGDTALYVNGELIDGAFDGDNEKVATIANYTDNGTLVEVYVDAAEADMITHVVVIKTQMMEIKRVGSDFVALSNVSPDNDSEVPESGYNQAPIQETIEDVEEDNEYYEFLRGLKAEDLVAVVPVAVDHDGDEFEVGKAYAPEEVTGKLSRAGIYGKTENQRQAISVTVGGTAYNVALWNKDLVDIKADDIKVTREDVKLYLDEYGNALRAKNVGKTEDFMIIKGYYSGVESGKLVRYVEGWDIKGNELSLNIGSNDDTYDTYRSVHKPGDLVNYTNEGAAGTAEWVLRSTDVYNIDTAQHTDGLKASNVRVRLVGETSPFYTADGMKFIYVTFDEDGDVDSIEVKDHMQAVTKADLDYTYNNNGGNWNPAQACLDDDKQVTAIVVKRESNEAISSNLLYIRDYNSEDIVDEDWGKIYGYTVAMMSEDGLDPEVSIYGNKDLDIGDFASYSAATREGYDNYYSLKKHTATMKTTSVNTATVYSILNADRNLVKLTDYVTRPTNISGSFSADLGVGDEHNVVDLSRAEWLDLYSDDHIDSVKDLRAAFARLKGDGSTSDYPRIDFVYNDNPDSDGFRMVSMVVVKESGVSSATVPEDKVRSDDNGWIAQLVDEDGNVILNLASGSKVANGTTAKPGNIITTGQQEYFIKITPTDAKATVEFTTPAGEEMPQATLSEATLGDATGATDTNFVFVVTAEDETTNTVTLGLTHGAPAPLNWTLYVEPQRVSGSSKNVNVLLRGSSSKDLVHYLNAEDFATIKAALEDPDNWKVTANGVDYTPASVELRTTNGDLITNRDQNPGVWDAESSFVKLKFDTRIVYDANTDVTKNTNTLTFTAPADADIGSVLNNQGASGGSTFEAEHPATP